MSQFHGKFAGGIIPWLVAYNLEINWEIGEVRMTRCPSICRWTPEKKVIKKK